MKTLTFDVFGRNVLIVETESGWQAYYQGSEGKRRPARDIILPSDLAESEIARYLDDLCHEWATDENKSVSKLD